MTVIRKLNYQHLLYFWTVVRTGSLTRASEELALSPPTISAQLRTLEARLGERLFRKSGRNLIPTEVGRLVFGYADEIFALGRDLVDALDHRPTTRPLRFVAGIDDVVPKEIAQRLLRPALAIEATRAHGVPGRNARAARGEPGRPRNRLILSDAPDHASAERPGIQPPWASARSRGWPLPTLAKTLRRGFPRSLDGVPVLLPTDDTAIRRSLDQWLDKHDVRPIIIGEFEDYALLRQFALAGHGFAPVPSVLEEQFRREHGFAPVGLAAKIEAEYFAISVERRLSNPAAVAIMANARKIFSA